MNIQKEIKISNGVFGDELFVVITPSDGGGVVEIKGETESFEVVAGKATDCVESIDLLVALLQEAKQEFIHRAEVA